MLNKKRVALVIFIIIAIIFLFLKGIIWIEMNW